jgi:heat shock transcription factor
VSNPANDDVISWTANGRTFTVWKPDLLEEKYLPETFKHSNFASFVRQLNNYGFRKCHSDRFEFGVTGFEKNKPELLTTLKRNEAPRMKSKTESTKNIKRKESKTSMIKATSTSPQPGRALPDSKEEPPTTPVGRKVGGRSASHKEGAPSGGHTALELGAFGNLTEEVDQLKRDRMVLLKEVMRLRLEQDDTVAQMRMMEQRVQQNEQFSAQMRSLLETLQQNPKLAMEFGEQLNNVSRFAPRKRRQSIPLLGGGENNKGKTNNNNNNNNNNNSDHESQMLLETSANHANHSRLQEIIDEQEREPSPKMFPNGNFALVPTPDKETGLAQFTWQEIMEGNTPSDTSTESLRQMVEGMSNEEEIGKDQQAFLSSILERTNSGLTKDKTAQEVGGANANVLPSVGSLENQLSLSFLDSDEMSNLVNDMKLSQKKEGKQK